ncbi:MAG: TPM domain-containing protein [Muribaculaceae bacterium]|nr:TPM domain-containing protein [Muribaculaceae bacterium]
MKNYYRILVLTFFTLFISVFTFGRDYSPEDITNPNIRDRRVYVADPANLVSPQAKAEANAILWNLRQKTGAEVVTVVVPNTGEYSREEFAVKLFDQWKVGKSDKDNGVIILIVPDQREAWIATGYGVEGIIPDISASRIINRSVVPHMKQNDLDGAVVAVSADVANVLSNPEAAEELKSQEKEAWEKAPETDLTEEDFIGFVITIVVVLFLISCFKLAYDSHQYKHLDRYSQARKWYESRTTYLLLAVFSLGLGLIPYWIYRRKYNKARNKPLVCPACKGKMHKLNEEEDNNLLSPSQDLEEKLNSVDYDVWVCDDCGTVERYAFPNKFTHYEECPHCHTVAMSMVKDHVVLPPTTRRTGIGERVYECKYCHNNTGKRYTIPKRSDGTAAALAAGAILGSGGRGGGGGGFGGGFGGGMTGGGGGGGRW